MINSIGIISAKKSIKAIKVEKKIYYVANKYLIKCTSGLKKCKISEFVFTTYLKFISLYLHFYKLITNNFYFICRYVSTNQLTKSTLL